MLERLKLNTKKELKLFCVSVHVADAMRLFASAELITQMSKPRFILGYSIDDVRNAVTDKFPASSVSFEIIGEIKMSDVLNNISEDDLFGELGAKFGKPAPVIAVRTPETNRQQFLQNLRLLADRFVGEDDKKTLIEIIDRSKVMMPSGESNQR